MPPWRPITQVALSMNGRIKRNGILHNWMSTKGEVEGDMTNQRLCRAIQDIVCDTDEGQPDNTESTNLDPSLFRPVGANSAIKELKNGQPVPDPRKFYFNEGDGLYDFIEVHLSCRFRVSDISPGGWDTIHESGWVSQPGANLQHVGDPRLCCRSPQDIRTSNTDHHSGQKQEGWMNAGVIAEGSCLHAPDNPTTSSANPSIDSAGRGGRPTRGNGGARVTRNSRGRGAKSRTDSGARRQEKLETRKAAAANVPQEIKHEPTIPMSHLYGPPYLPYQNPYMGNYIPQPLQNAALHDTTLPQIPEEEEFLAIDPML